MSTIFNPPPGTSTGSTFNSPSYVVGVSSQAFMPAQCPPPEGTTCDTYNRTVPFTAAVRRRTCVDNPEVNCYGYNLVNGPSDILETGTDIGLVYMVHRGVACSPIDNVGYDL